MPGVQAMRIEGIMSFAAGWCATDDVVMLLVSVSVLVVVKEWEDKSILDDTDDLTWEAMFEDWNTFLASPAVCKI